MAQKSSHLLVPSSILLVIDTTKIVSVLYNVKYMRRTKG